MPRTVSFPGIKARLPFVLHEFLEPIKVGSDGHVRLVDVFGSDESIVQAARVSYGKGTKTVSEDRGLIRYLMRHSHCYRGDMEVLTASGWKRWDECGWNETYLVPQPETRTFTKETLPLEIFNVEEELVTFGNQRMSFAVTGHHRMWFKGAYADSFDIFRAESMPRWGHFDPLAGYELRSEDVYDPLYALLGFVLGDGSYASTNTISFHLKKSRKQAWLRKTAELAGIQLKEAQSSSHDDATVFSFTLSDNLRELFSQHTHIGARTKDKDLFGLETLTMGQARSLVEGLTQSDGHEKPDRPQIEFSSISESLLNGWQTLHAMLGVDAHRTKNGSTAYAGQRTSLEARKQYFGREFYRGQVYCTTTSSGLLMVRGGPDKFAFVCGNTTPFEMCEIKLHLRVPMDIWRQWIRHRTASVNEYSTRYSEAIDSVAKTNPDEWRLQSNLNKQGSVGFVTEFPEGFEKYQNCATAFSEGEWTEMSPGEYLTAREAEVQKLAKEVYEERLKMGVAREQARKDLPLSNYTEAYWKIDLHNLFHFLSLRLDSHAQLEIRQYAEAIAKIVNAWVPIAWEAFNDFNFRRNAVQFSAAEMMVLRTILQSTEINTGNSLQEIWSYFAEGQEHHMSKREWAEFWQKLEGDSFV